MAEKKPSQKEVFNYIAAQFGLTDALLDLDTTDPKKGFTLKEAFDQIRRQKITDPARAAQILAKTNWFKTYGTEVTKRLAAEASNLGSFKEQVRASKASLVDALATKGIKLSEADVNQLARDIYVFGLNQSQIMNRIASAKSFSTSGNGELGANLDTLEALAAANGVTVNGVDAQGWLKEIARGNKTIEDYERTLRENAAQRYTVFADQIRNGENLTDLVRPYKQMMSEILEVPESDIDFNDPQFRDGKAFTATGADGKPAAKPLWEFRKELMADPRWQRTRNARETYTNFGTSVLKRFGVMA